MAAQVNPPIFEDVVSRASLAREQNDVPRAIELYEQALQLKPDWSDGWWFLGSLHYGASAYPAARDALTHYVEMNPKAGPALALRGLCEFETAEYAQSLQDIQRGLSLGAANQARNEKILRYHEALLLTRSEKFEAALRAYAYFAADDNPNPELLLAAGLAGLRAPLLPKDIAAGKEDLFVGTGRALFSFLRGDRHKAQQAFQEVWQRFPAAANVHYLYGYLLFATDPDQSLAELNRELEVSPSNGAAHVLLAWAALMRNRPAEALPYARRAVAEEPVLSGAQLVLGRSLAETGDWDGGIRHLEKALQLEPDNLEIHLALARAYSGSGRKADARRERLQCLQLTRNEAAPVAHP